LSVALAARGHLVSFYTGTTKPRDFQGVRCRSFKTIPPNAFADCDVLIVLNGPAQICVALRPHLPPKCQLILWTQHAPDQPRMSALQRPEVRAGWDAIACVSQWHSAAMLRHFGLDPNRVAVLRNAIGPAFENLFPDAAALAAAKSSTPVLAYTSTPFRGLEVLLTLFPEVYRYDNRARLRVYSSMKVYGQDESKDRYMHLYEQCRSTPGVEYVGSLSQPLLAESLKSGVILSYPNTYVETSCIAVMEAMAAGLLVVTSELGALPETTMGMGVLVPVSDKVETYASAYTDRLVAALRETRDNSEQFWEARWQQVCAFNAQCTWPVRAAEWERFLQDRTTATHVASSHSPITSSASNARTDSTDIEPGRMTLRQHLESGISHHQAGRSAEAEKIYRQILVQEPDNVGALHLLGVLAIQTCQFDSAVELIQRVIRLKPDFADAHSNLGSALRRLGRIDEAIASCRQAIQVKPDFGEAYNNLGNALMDKKHTDEAVDAFKQCIRLKPDFADAHNNLGKALADAGQWDLVISSYREAIRLNLSFAEAHNNLGDALNHEGKIEEAVFSYQQAIHHRADFALAHFNLGNALKDMRKFEGSIVAYRQAIRFKPDFIEAYNNLGNVLMNRGRLDEAVVTFQQAIRLQPDCAAVHANLGNALTNTGQPDEAIACYREAIRIAPENASAHGNLVFHLHYHPGCDAGMIYSELRRWNHQHAEPLGKFIQLHANNRDPDRRLRIGYVSPDFRNHVVGQNLLPLLGEHDHGQLEIFCYSNVACPDNITEQFRVFADEWRYIARLSDSQTVDLIRKDRIDILVDLSLHTRRNALAVFACKPAPVQATFAGYPGSTGLDTIDYRLTDPYLDPPGLSDKFYSERSLRLPDSFWCYQPLVAEVATKGLPARTFGFISFGCLNKLCKINDQVLDLWARVLKAVDRSRITILCPEGSARQRLLHGLRRNGIESERINLVGRCLRAEYLELYNQIDIGLDTFPYNGHTTSLDSFWMGVPVVTLVGRTVVGRAGLSQLSNLGLSELVAETPEEYVKIAVDLANDLPRLAELRRGLRERMRTSPLMDAPRFARNVEAAYRQMWREWCRDGK
jgi:protein O-GlcNAc transferase